ncbi:RNA polymerase sigma-54 factor rpoN [Borrelia hermsii MTW]|nr:RNA polymerase sigma-54 factor rpoN [Borrelia hermsii MTW]
MLENTQDKLKEELNINTQDLNDALNTIRLKLNPNPTFEFKDKNDTNNYIEPDIIIITKGNALKIKIKEVNIFKKDVKKQEIKDSKKI